MRPLDRSPAANTGVEGGARGLGILQIVRNLDTGGAQEVVRTLVENLADAGQRPVVCSLADGPLATEVRAMGIPVEILPGRRHSIMAPHRFYSEMAAIRRALVEIVNRYDISIVQTHLLRSLDFVVASLGWRSRHPLVFWTFHNSEFTLRREHLPRHRWLLGPKRLAYRLLYRFGSRWVAGLVAVSGDVKIAIRSDIGRVDDRVTVITNGVDTRRFRPDDDARRAVRRELGMDERATLILMVGTFKRQKGHRELIQSARAVVGEFPDAHFLLAGDGPLLDACRSLASELGLGDRIGFLGDRRDVGRLLNAADLFILPSLWEGLPMALLEAMASGLPCIASAVSGTSEVIEDGVSGILVPPGDIEELTRALRTVLSDLPGTRSLGAAARSRVIEQFSAARQAADHLDLFLRAMTHAEGTERAGAG